ncbi:MAG: histidinol dehydrogenase [Candidatus Margulisiibacteriota bacterium]|jgi:histidinol dehydrogenase
MKLIKTNHLQIINKLKSKFKDFENKSLLNSLNKIRKNIRNHGDQALIEYLIAFDNLKNPKDFQFQVTKNEIKEAYTKVEKSVVAALTRAKENIVKYHEKQFPVSWFTKAQTGVKYGQKFSAIDQVGIYVPGGNAVYPSSVLMNAVPAKIAKVRDLIMITPPNQEGNVPAVTLVAADLCGVDTIYKVGGAQGIFALAYGTESIQKVAKIVGPGNRYVTLAKQMVYGQVDIDKPAGPSEVMIYIDNKKYISFAASDFIAQLEHNPDSIAIVVSEDQAILNFLKKEIFKQTEAALRRVIIEKALANSFLLATKNLEESLMVINEYAAEHVVILSENATQIEPKIINAGAIFIGPYTPVTLGDYYAGPNHVLPTLGAAKFASPLNVLDFMKSTSLLQYSKNALALALPDLELLTEVEGLDAHKKSVEIRF